MSGILVVAEARHGELREISLELITTARALKDQGAGRLVVGVSDADDAVLGQLNVTGVDEIVSTATPRGFFEAHVAEQVLDALIADVDPEIVLAGHTVDGLASAPAVAARADAGFTSNAMEMELRDGRSVVRRGAYGDRLVAEVDFPGKDRVVVLMRPGSNEPAQGSGSASTRALDVAFDGSQMPTEHVEFREAEVGDVDITRADFLLAVGRGIEDEQALEPIEALASQIGAIMCASRPLIDAGWVVSSRQVGQSGKTVTPKIYLALGISGAVQHLAGMRKSETIIAVNKDPEAPIFGVSDFGAVADLFEVVDFLVEHFN